MAAIRGAGVGGGEKQVRATKRPKLSVTKSLSQRYEMSSGNVVSNHMILLYCDRG